MQLTRRWLTVTLAAALAFGLVLVPGPADGSGYRTYEVTITNISGTQPLTPPVLAAHHRRADVYTSGHRATQFVQAVAENGAVPVLVAHLEAQRRVAGVVVAGGGPLFPGDSVTVTVRAPRWAKRLSAVAMLICTNDGFTGFDGVKLPSKLGHTEWVRGIAYDAGTELNTEDFTDLVPPCAPLSGVDTDAMGIGFTDPALAEGGVVHPHAGIEGNGDLTDAAHGWSGAIVEVAIIRIGDD